MNRQVDMYLIDGCGRCHLGGTPECKVHSWKKELALLRSIILDTGLNEELKWGMPCYTFQKNNVLILAAFKHYCSISFFKGSLLKDPEGVLNKPGENSQAARLFKFTNVKEIVKLENTIKTYIQEAVEIEKAGLKVNFKKVSEFKVPEEFQNKLNEMPVLKKAFYSLTPGRQRGYLLYFSEAKQAKTREARIEKYLDKILNGKGITD